MTTRGVAGDPTLLSAGDHSGHATICRCQSHTLAGKESVHCISSDFHSSSPPLPVVSESSDLNIPADMFCHNRRWLWFRLRAVMADPAPRWKRIIPQPAGTARSACLVYTSATCLQRVTVTFDSAAWLYLFQAQHKWTLSQLNRKHLVTNSRLSLDMKCLKEKDWMDVHAVICI